MNVRKYLNAKGNWCFYVTNSTTDRFRVSSEISNERSAETARKTLESLLPMNKNQIENWLKKGECSYLFDEIIDKFIRRQSMESGWEYPTIKHFEGLRRRINDHYGKIYIDDMDEDWMFGYVKWRSATVLNTTVQKEIKSLKQIFRFASRITKEKYEITEFNMKLKKTSLPNVIFLTMEELKKLQTSELSSPHLERTRDLFLFGCFTGMRYSDIQKFSMSNVDGGMITFTTKKTNDTLHIPINGIVQSIIDKYKGSLPKMQNQVYNRFIKEMCREVGIDTPVTEIHYKNNVRMELTEPKWKLISSHSARKTFVSNALMIGIGTSVVMSMTGHHSFQSLQSYVAVADRSKKEAVKMMESLLA